MVAEYLYFPVYHKNFLRTKKPCYRSEKEIKSGSKA